MENCLFISDSGDEAIDMDYTNFTHIRSNDIYFCNKGITITNKINNCTFHDNFINSCSVGLSEGAGCNWNMVNYNNALSCTTPFDLTGTKTIEFAGTTNFGAVS